MCEALRTDGYDLSFLLLAPPGTRIDGTQKWFGTKAFQHLEFCNPLKKFRFCGLPIPDRIGNRLAERGLISYSVDQWYNDRLDARLAGLAGEPWDAVICNYVFLSRALLPFRGRALTILDTHDVYANRHKMLMGCGLKPQWFFTSPVEETKGLRRADRVLAIQENEAAVFRQQLRGRGDVRVVGHLIPPRPLDIRDGAGSPLRLLYAASNNNLNVTALKKFLDEVWPPIRARTPAVELWVYGSVCDSVFPREGVRLCGIINEMKRAYEETDVAINPMSAGSGLKIKSIEALAFGRPLIGGKAALDGLTETTQGAMFVAETQDEWVSVIKLFSDGGREFLLQKMREASAYAEAYHQCALTSLRDALR